MYNVYKRGHKHDILPLDKYIIEIKEQNNGRTQGSHGPQ